MADFAHRKTDILLADVEKGIAEIYALASRELNEKIIAYFAKFVKRDEEMRKKVEDSEVSEHDYQQWRLAQMGRGERFQTMRDDYAKRVNEANQAAAAYINDNTPGIYSLNRNYSAYTIEQVCGDVGFTLYDEQTVRRLIVDAPDLFPAPRVDIPADKKWNRQRLTAELTSGILQGESISKLADRFQKVTDMNCTSAVRNARTAVTGAQNAGRQASYDRAQEMGLPLRKRWIATKDGRTRHDHRRADGQTVALDEPFTVGGDKLMHPGDTKGSPENIYNCRCTMRTVEKDGIEAEPRMMRVKNPETGKYELVSEMTYDEWEQWKNAQRSLKIEPDSSIIKSLDVDDFELFSYSENIAPEVSKVITDTVKAFERRGGVWISEAKFGNFVDEATGKTAIFQVAPNADGTLILNVNTSVIGGHTVAEIDAMMARTTINLPRTLEEAIVHECGHAKSYYQKSYAEIKAMLEELSECGVEGISKIASQDGAECIAEVEVLLFRGEPVPEEAMALYKKWVGED